MRWKNNNNLQMSSSSSIWKPVEVLILGATADFMWGTQGRRPAVYVLANRWFNGCYSLRTSAYIKMFRTLCILWSSWLFKSFPLLLSPSITISHTTSSLHSLYCPLFLLIINSVAHPVANAGPRTKNKTWNFLEKYVLPQINRKRGWGCLRSPVECAAHPAARLRVPQKPHCVTAELHHAATTFTFGETRVKWVYILDKKYTVHSWQRTLNSDDLTDSAELAFLNYPPNFVNSL